MLPAKQREVVEMYYNADLTLAEIAQHCGITRQGVREAIKRAENQLLDCEEKLGLYRRFHDIAEGLEEISGHAAYLREENRRLAYSEEYAKRCDRIIQIAGAQQYIDHITPGGKVAGMAFEGLSHKLDQVVYQKAEKPGKVRKATSRRPFARFARPAWRRTNN
jgi:predicted DNA-binding protein YlxM (UPF0122 family)